MSVRTVTIYGEDADGKTVFQQELEENDEEELLNFINSKRSIPLADKSKNLTIAAEVHTEWNYQTEKLRGERIRGFIFREYEEVGDEIFEPGDSIAQGPNDFDIQFDFFMDWKTDKTWAKSHIRYDNSAGVSDNGIDRKIDPRGFHGSGSVDNLALREAFVGYEIFKCKDDRLTIEVGRRGNLYKAFYSEIQFSSRLDGIVLKYSSKRGGFADWYITGAGFVVDERATHYAWVVELGLNNILNSGINFKYSFIDWQLHGRNRYFQKNPLGFRFKVSQVALLYNFTPEWLCGHEVQLSGAFMMNHIPARYTFINANQDLRKKGYTPLKQKIGTQNLGAYVNIQLGTIAHEGDWFVSGLAAFCEAQCIPDNDVRNIGAGNFLRESMTSDGRGNTNWKGYSLKAGYALTNNFVVETEYNHSWSLISIAGSEGYTRYTIGTIYSF